MILCRKLETIFVKTRKVGGTSFEIALSKYCDQDDIVTPITPADEALREKLGFQGPVNFSAENRSHILTDENVKGEFWNHMPCELIHENLKDSAFNSFTKISIHRDPLDFLISQYFFRTRVRPRLFRPSFKRWLSKNYTNVIQNYQITPASGLFSPDIILSYEHLVDDIRTKTNLPGDFIDVFKTLNSKGNFRSAQSRDVKAFFEKNKCSEFIPKVEQLLFSHNG